MAFVLKALTFFAVIFHCCSFKTGTWGQRRRSWTTVSDFKSDKSIMVVGANPDVNKMVEKHFKTNGFPNAIGMMCPADIDLIESKIKSSTYFLILLGVLVPKYPDFEKRLREAVATFSPETLIYQNTPPPAPKEGEPSGAPSPATSTEDMGRRIAASNLEIAMRFISENA